MRANSRPMLARSSSASQGGAVRFRAGGLLLGCKSRYIVVTTLVLRIAAEVTREVGGEILSVRTRRRALLLGATMAALLAACQKPPQEIFQEGMDAYRQGDYAVAMNRWRPLAEAGNADAQTNVGLLYSQGKGVAADPAEAFEWYRKAAVQNHM